MSQAIAIVECVETWQEHNPAGTSVTPVAGVTGGSDRSGRPVGRVGTPETEMTSVRFAQVARQLAMEAKRHGLLSPAFRSPPKVPGATRSIRRRADGSATVSVALRGRPAVAVTADMIDGVMAANERSTRSAAVRDRLWAAAIPLVLSDSAAPASARSGRGFPSSDPRKSLDGAGPSRPVAA